MTWLSLCRAPSLLLEPSLRLPPAFPLTSFSFLWAGSLPVSRVESRGLCPRCSVPRLLPPTSPHSLDHQDCLPLSASLLTSSPPATLALPRPHALHCHPASSLASLPPLSPHQPVPTHSSPCNSKPTVSLKNAPMFCLPLPPTTSHRWRQNSTWPCVPTRPLPAPVTAPATPPPGDSPGSQEAASFPTRLCPHTSCPFCSECTCASRGPGKL